MNLKEKESKFILQTYKRTNLVVEKAKGKFVWDNRGKKYLDFLAGISVCNLGHCNPKIVKAAKKQCEKYMHVSNLYYIEPQIKLAEELVKKSLMDKVFFSNSGAEANECAIKLARKWGSQRGRNEIISLSNSFHGRTLATLSATVQDKFHKGFEPLLEGFKYAKFNDIDSVKSQINDKTVAIIIEPIQGEGGVNIAKRTFLQNLRNLCDEHQILLIFDEIQCGLGRTGTLFAYQHYNIMPDIITLAKGLANGLPLGSTLLKDKIAWSIGYGDHGSTFGGNPVCCAAALATMRIINPGFIKKMNKTASYLSKKLNELKKDYSFIKEVRSIGLMAGIELAFSGKELVSLCQQKGLLINCTNNNVIRFLPPLIIGREDIEVALKIIREVFDKIYTIGRMRSK